MVSHWWWKREGTRWGKKERPSKPLCYANKSHILHQKQCIKLKRPQTSRALFYPQTGFNSATVPMKAFVRVFQKKKNCTEHKHKPFVLGIVIAYRKASFKSFSILAINFIDMLFLHQPMVRFLRIFFVLLFCFFQFSSFVFRFQVTVNITKGRFQNETVFLEVRRRYFNSFILKRLSRT